ncbi:MAG: CHAT domain-containing protein [Thermodesulfobacteriota bacterium]
MEALVTIRGSDVFATASGHECRVELNADSLAKMQSLAARYRKSVLLHDSSLLLGLGTELFAWLDASGWASAWAKGGGNRVLRVHVKDPDSQGGAALLDLPWEILAWNKDFLAADPAQAFVVFRSIHENSDPQPAEPRFKDLALLFMAAAPRGQKELDFEAEEAGILGATEGLPLQLCVEESGALDFLKDRLALDGPFEALHLSCHGNIDKEKGPVLALESPEGDEAPALPGEIAAALGEHRAPLVFLSACRTAEAGGEKKAGSGAGESFCRALVRSGVANVLGWDGSVYDKDATSFARSFYHELAGYASVPYAAAAARRQVLWEHRNEMQARHGGNPKEAEKKLGERRDGPDGDSHWHLARVYAGEQGGGALCLQKRPGRALRRDAGFFEFLDQARKEVKVASARTFVGRRRLAQDVLRAFRNPHGTGVLLWGMGNIGKSSLAARIANRLPRLETVVIYGRYDGLAIFDRLVAALPPRDRPAVEAAWRPGLANNEALLGNALEEMLKGPFNEKPILLIVDDLERILEEPSPGEMITPVKEPYRKALGGVLRAFGAATTSSRLLLTSRFCFTLPDKYGEDLGRRLTAVNVVTMQDRERDKQWRAALEGRTEPGGAGQDLAREIRTEAAGNPGLQEILCRPVLSGQLAEARNALEAIRKWKASGRVPEEQSAAQEFFKRVTLETYEAALTAGQRAQLRASTVFSEGCPAPVEALEAVGAAAEVGDPAAAVARLIGLGMFDVWGKIGGVEYASANPLARPLAKGALSEEEERTLAAAAMPVLARLWANKDGDFPHDPRGVEAARLALAGHVSDSILEKAVKAAGNFLFSYEHDARTAWAIFAPALERLEQNKSLSDPVFVLRASNCAERIGETQRQVELLELGMALPSGNKVALAQIATLHAEATIGRDGPEKALEKQRKAAELFREEGDDFSHAVCMGKIADILDRRGETEEALRIRKEEELPVYERLGDVRSRAVCMGQIADILAQRGETEEALRIRKEEELPVYERLGDVRSRAVCMGKIADILYQQGEVEEVLRIRKEEELPVYERLRDVRERAVCLSKIADILVQQEKTDEALQIQKEDCLPAYIALQDMDGIANSRFSCAQIRLKRGGLEKGEAQVIYDELAESFAINQKIRRADGIAYSGFLLGQVLARGGHLEKGLEVLDVSAAAFEKLQMMDWAKQVREVQQIIRERMKQ